MDGCWEALPPARSVPASARGEGKGGGPGCHGHRPVCRGGAELIARISRVIVAYRKQNKGNYYSSLVGGPWLISLRAAARRRGNLTVLIKRSAAAQSNYGETVGLCWGLSPTLGSGRAEHVLSSQGALWQGKVGAPPRLQVPSPMSVLMPGLPKPPPEAK